MSNLIVPDIISPRSLVKDIIDNAHDLNVGIL